MAEFAITLPILAMLLFGVIQFGIAFNHYLTLTDATRAGARKAVVSRRSGDPEGDCLKAIRFAATDLDWNKVEPTCDSDWESGSDVFVRATYPYSISLLGINIASGRMTSTTTERVE